MGIWGNGVFDNDVAIDIKDMLGSIIDSSGNIDDALGRTMAYISKSLDEEDVSLACTALGRIVGNRDVFNDAQIHMVREYCRNMGLCEDELHNLFHSEHKSNEAMKRDSKNYICPWKLGDVFLYDIADAFTSIEGFDGWKIGIYKVGNINIDSNIYPIVYFFRTRFSDRQISDDMSLLRECQLWPVCNWKEQGMAYRAILITSRQNQLPKRKLHYCGNTQHFAKPANEFILLDEVSNPMFFWKSLENRLLQTVVLID